MTSAKKPLAASALSQLTHEPIKAKPLPSNFSSSTPTTSIRVTVEADKSSSEDLDIDSLMINEVATKVAKDFAMKIDTHNFENLSNIKSLCDLILDLRAANNDGACDRENDNSPSFSLMMHLLLHQTLNASR